MNTKSLHRKLVAWYHRRARPLPWRELWRLNNDPWHIWVSEIMLQQTVIKAVLPVYDRFLKQFPHPSDLAKADTETVRLSVRGLGYYRRFDFLHRAAKYLMNELKGQWPQDYDGWKALPGIGDYTASAITSITLDAPHGVVDGNVERVLCRLLDIRTAPNLPELKAQFKVVMDEMANMGDPGTLNQSVMELGQTICTPTSPACELCPISKDCLAFERGSQHLAPAAKARPTFLDIEMALIVPKCGTEIALTRRSKKASFLKDTLGFPTMIRSTDGSWAGDGFDAPPWMLQALKNQKSPRSIRHNITKHKITASIITVDRPWSKDFEAKMDLATIEQILVSNLDRKALKHL